MHVITLRLPADVKRRLQEFASSRGESLNHFLGSIAVQTLVGEETARRVWARRSRGSTSRAIAVLGRVPARKPLPGDEMPRKRPARTRRG